MLRGPLRRLIRRIERRRVRRDTQSRASHGIPMWITTNGAHGSHDELFARVGAALDLIAAHQPWRLARIRRDVRRIWAHRQPSFRASYRHDAGACVLDTYFVMNHPAEAVAASIAHEAVHARIARLPIVRQDRAREERLCRRAEVSLGHALPNGAAVVARAHAARIASDDEVAPPVDWEEVARVRRRVQVRELGLPAWLERWLLARVR
jgi:hypothetical protein